jgi:membrane protein
MFAGFERALQDYFLQNLVPDNIARPVMRSLTQFAAKARDMGTLGLVLLVATALALLLTIDRTLNGIWRVRRGRSFARRVLVYWAALTLGPLLVGVSLTLTTYALTDTTRVARTLSRVAEIGLQVVEFVAFALGVSAFFRWVPNTHVRWRHALAGGIFVAVGLQIAKRGLAWWVSWAGTYATVYGAFSAVPIFLLWVYLVWVIVLLGAVIAAYAPSLSMHIVDAPGMVGQRFTTAVAVLRELDAARRGPERGLSIEHIARQLRADPLRIEPAVDTLVALDWVARVDEEHDARQRLVLLADPATTPAAPLVDRVLMSPLPATQAVRRRLGLDGLTVADLLGQEGQAPPR